MDEPLPFDPALVDRMGAVTTNDVQLVPCPGRTLLALRAAPAARGRAAQALGIDALPAPNRAVEVRGGGECLWMRPDEWYVTARAGDVASVLAELATAVGPADGTVVDLSASRVVMELAGARSRDVLAAACPLDLHPREFAVGQCAQTLVGRAPVLIQRLPGERSWRLYVRVSLVGYVVSWLTDAMEGG